MNLSAFIHSEKDRHGLRSMKIDPVASIVPCYTPSGKRVALNTQHQGLPIGTALYSEAQMRQLGEACTSVCDDDVTVDRIRELVKEMLP